MGEPRHRNPDRFVVIGTNGAGKTTIAKRIARILGLSHVELDAYRHGPNWAETPDDLFRERLREALRGDAWVADGNYNVTRGVVWPRATTLVWLDYPIYVVMWRLFWRTMRRGVFGEELWNGNRERLWWHFFSRYSSGLSRRIGGAAGPCRRSWPSRSICIWMLSGCARRGPQRSGLRP